MRRRREHEENMERTWKEEENMKGRREHGKKKRT